MSKTRHEVKPATRVDVIEVCGSPPERTIRAWAFHDESGPVAIAGYFKVNGTAVVFSDIKPGADAPKLAIWRHAKDFMSKINGPALCHGSTESRAFLERLGWTHLGLAKGGGEVFEWQL